MTSRIVFVTVGIAATLGLPLAAAQHDQHQAGAQAAGAPAAQVSECVQAQPVVTNLLDASLQRIEAARLTNNAAAMRDAADDLQSALIDIRTQLAPCATMQAATDAHAGHAMPGVPQAPAAAPAPRPSAPAPAAADPHAGHAAPAAPAAGPRPASPARPATAAPPAAPADHAGHGGAAAPAAAATAAAPAPRPGLLPAPAAALESLRCQSPVDARTAPRMLHQGRMYYFCAEQDRAAFAKDPSKYALPAGEAVPAHAH